MGLISLNIGELSPAIAPQTATAPATRQKFDATELGATGTPIFGGFLRELGEYNGELTGLAAYRVYERMRRSDAQVWATLQAIKLPILGAEWAIQEPDNASAVEKEAAKFVESCLFEELDHKAIIKNALLELDFGACAHEDVYYIDGKNVRLKKCAPRLPLTFYRWLTGPGGDELVALEQMGYRGGDYIVTEVPASKLALFTYMQEGANFTGISLQRSMYQHWYIKNNLYKVEAIAIERNGMGVPWITMGPDAKVEDRLAAQGWLGSLAVNETTSIALPNGWNFGLEGVKGSVHSPKDAIEHHNSMITQAALAQFMNLGGTGHSGSRALGETMFDFFYLSLQAEAEHIGNVISMATIKRLCDLNFVGIENYPKLVPQQILSTKFEAAVDALNKLATGAVNIIQPDQGLEDWARAKIGAPAAKNPRPRPAGGGGAATSGSGGTSASQLSTATFVPKRALKGPERFMMLSEISSRLDKGRDEVAAALRAARPRIQAEVLQKLMSRPMRESHRVSVDLDGKLVDHIENILTGVGEYGLASVESERTKQRSGANLPTAQTVRAAGATKRDPLGVYADGVVSEYTNALQARAAAVMIDARRKTDATVGEQLLQAGEALDDQSDGWIDNIAAKGANEAFAEGRAEGYDKFADEIAGVQYSALLDPNTCDRCAAADGAEGKTPDEIPDVPNPDCDGGDKCRCVHVFVFGDESESKA